MLRSSGNGGDTAGRPLASQKRIIWRLVFVALLFALAAWLMWLFQTSEPFRDCIKQRKNYDAYQALHKEAFFAVKFFVRSGLDGACAVHVINAYQGAVAALSGIVVAFFTATLWWVTWGMVRIAKDQREDTLRSIVAAEQAAGAASLNANAVLGVELPRLELSSASWSPLFSSEFDKLREGGIVIRLRNHGRTGAHIIEDCVVADVPEYDFMPDEPRYHILGVEKADIGVIVAPEDSHPIFCDGKLSITADQVQNILNLDKTIYLWVC